MTHWMVSSPEIMLDAGNLYGYSPEPPEYGCCVAFVDAPTRAKAKAAALKTDDFDRWRDDGGNPFRGLSVMRTVCEHGVCWCDRCAPRDGYACPACEAATGALP